MKHEPRPATHMEKQLGWACKSGGMESLGISMMGQTVLARLMESQIQHQSAGSVALCGEGSEKGQWCLPDNSVSPCMPLVLDLEIPSLSQAMNLGWLFLVPGLGHLATIMWVRGSLILAVTCLRGFRLL